MIKPQKEFEGFFSVFFWSEKLSEKMKFERKTHQLKLSVKETSQQSFHLCIVRLQQQSVFISVQDTFPLPPLLSSLLSLPPLPPPLLLILLLSTSNQTFPTSVTPESRSLPRPPSSLISLSDSRTPLGGVFG